MPSTPQSSEIAKSENDASRDDSIDKDLLKTYPREELMLTNEKLEAAISDIRRSIALSRSNRRSASTLRH